MLALLQTLRIVPVLLHVLSQVRQVSKEMAVRALFDRIRVVRNARNRHDVLQTRTVRNVRRQVDVDVNARFYAVVL